MAYEVADVTSQGFSQWWPESSFSAPEQIFRVSLKEILSGH